MTKTVTNFSPETSPEPGNVGDSFPMKPSVQPSMQQCGVQAVDTLRACHNRPVVVLVGPPGAGKSTIGRRLARALNVELVDTDSLIEKAYHQPCGEVFAELGETEFRRVEATFVEQALNSGGVVSLGGGAVVTESNRALLNDHTVVWVDVSAEEGVKRTSADDSRPVLAAEDPHAHYRSILDARRPWYREVADYRVRTDHRAPQQSVADILAFVESM